MTNRILHASTAWAPWWLGLALLLQTAAAQEAPVAPVAPVAPASAAAAAPTARPTPYAPPLRVAPVGVTQPPGAQAPTPQLPSAARAQPPVATSCDAAGCWDSNGQRLHRVGPNLVGPRGTTCTQVAGVLNCP